MPGSRGCRSSPTRRSTPRPSTARSATRPPRPLVSATDGPTRWTRRIRRRRCAKWGGARLPRSGDPPPTPLPPSARIGPMTSRLFQQARRYIAGGVNSPVRAFRAVGGEPVFIRRGAGSRVWDSEGRQYIDYLGSWGPLILGHCHPRVIAALEETCEGGTSFGMPTEIETELARRVAEAFRAVETLRFVNSGTEATMSTLRLARAFTGRELIVKMAGCYHGHADS